jgi:hypothetical protein
MRLSVALKGADRSRDKNTSFVPGRLPIGRDRGRAMLWPEAQRNYA